MNKSIKNKTVFTHKASEPSVLVDIVDLDSQGRGVGRLDDGRVVFVPHALPLERVLISLEGFKKNYALARILEIIQPSPHRKKPPCAAFYRCGGCSLQHLDYSAQLHYKTTLVSSNFKKAATNVTKEKASNERDFLPIVEDCHPSPKQYFYRNKAVFRLFVLDGRVEMGFFEEKTHQIVDIECCYICSEGINSAFSSIKAFFYDNSSKFNGVSASITIKEIDGSILLCFLFSKPCSENFSGLIKALNGSFNEVSILIGREGDTTSRLAPKLIFGNGFIRNKMLDVVFDVYNETFLQINSGTASCLYQDALLSLVGKQNVVIDAYSGIGILSALFAKKALIVYAIEIVPKSTTAAKRLAKLNNIDNIIALNGDCASVLPKVFVDISKNFPQKQITTLLDPPRKGCDLRVISTLLLNKPDKIIYISCDSATLCRDLMLLKEEYSIKTLRPFDMFANTSKVETIALLEKKH